MSYNNYKSNQGNPNSGYGGNRAPAPQGNGGYSAPQSRQGEAQESKFVELCGVWEKQGKIGSYSSGTPKPGTNRDEALRLIAAGHKILIFPVENPKDDRQPTHRIVVAREPPQPKGQGGGRGYNGN